MFVGDQSDPIPATASIGTFREIVEVDIEEHLLMFFLGNLRQEGLGIGKAANSVRDPGSIDEILMWFALLLADYVDVADKTEIGGSQNMAIVKRVELLPTKQSDIPRRVGVQRQELFTLLGVVSRQVLMPIERDQAGYPLVSQASRPAQPKEEGVPMVLEKSNFDRSVSARWVPENICLAPRG